LEAPHYGPDYQNNDYENSINYEAATQSLLQRWLREVYNIHVWPKYGEKGYFCIVGKSDMDEIEGWWEKYEEALEAGLFNALNLI
jgi:hypothetical protein